MTTARFIFGLSSKGGYLGGLRPVATADASTIFRAELLRLAGRPRHQGQAYARSTGPRSHEVTDAEQNEASSDLQQRALAVRLRSMQVKKLSSEACAELARLEGAHGQDLYRYAFLLTGSSAEAQDLVQEALVSVAGLGDRVLGIDRLDHYLRRTIWNLQATRTRRAGVYRRLVPRLLIRTTTDDSAEQVTLRDALWAGLRRLPARQRCALVLRHYEDRSDPDIADILGCTTGTVRSLVSRGLAQLRLDLPEQLGLALDENSSSGVTKGT